MLILVDKHILIDKTFRSMEQIPEIIAHTYGQLILNKGAKTIQCLFNKQYRHNWIATCGIMKLDICLTLYTQVNSEWIIDLSLGLKL